MIWVVGSRIEKSFLKWYNYKNKIWKRDKMNILEKMEPYSGLSSWAIWESSNPNGLLEKEKDLIEDMDFNKYVGTLQQSNYVILAMNPGGAYNEEIALNSTRKIRTDNRKWSNFHNIGRSRDFLLGRAIMETKLKGSYMTDLFPIVGSKSNDIKKFINDKKNKTLVDNLIKEFDEEMNCLLPNEKEIRLICIGKDVFNWANKLLVENKNLKFNYCPHEFPHYSSANSGQVSNKENSEKFYPKVIKQKIKEYQLDLL